MVATLLGLEVERARAPEWASDEAAHDFVEAVLERRLTDQSTTSSPGPRSSAPISATAPASSTCVPTRTLPRPGEWRERVLMLTLRAVRAGGTGAIAYASHNDAGEAGEVAAIVPTDALDQIARAAHEVQSELGTALPGFEVTRRLQPPRRLRHPSSTAPARRRCWPSMSARPRAARRSPFEETGSYRLLLPAMSEDPGELERFYDETVAPLAAYDDQYETELVATVEAYLENDGNVTPTAETLFTHRHTVRYRLERVRELCGHDLSSTEGREKLGLGLKAMRVLGIPAPRGPAMEPRRKRAQRRRVTSGRFRYSGGRTRTRTSGTKSSRATNYTTPEGRFDSTRLRSRFRPTGDTNICSCPKTRCSPKQQLREAVARSLSWAETLRNLAMRLGAGTTATVKKYVASAGASTRRISIRQASGGGALLGIEPAAATGQRSRRRIGLLAAAISRAALLARV